MGSLPNRLFPISVHRTRYEILKRKSFYGCEDIYMQTYVTLEARVAALHYMDRIWRNGPYIGGHLAFLFQIEF